jgi:hypothetical protein
VCQAIAKVLIGAQTADDIRKDSKSEEMARIRTLARYRGDFADRRQV